jgi:hypothetical protein
MTEGKARAKQKRVLRRCAPQDDKVVVEVDESKSRSFVAALLLMTAP